MFSESKFSGDLSNWNVRSNAYTNNMFINSPLETNTPDWYKD
jgi:hypothetical protein